MAFSDKQREVMQKLRDLAIKHGLDPTHVLTTASIESSFDPDAKNGLHTGLFQFGPSEWKSYGTGKGDRMGGMDLEDQVLGFKNYQDVLRRQLADKLGREPTLNELYLAHQQGGAGALSLIQNSQRPASSVVPSGNITANAGTDADTGQQFIDRWNQKYGAHSALVNDQPLPAADGSQISTAAATGANQQIADLLKPHLNAQQNKGFDYGGLLGSGMKAMAQADPASMGGGQGGGGPPPMPNLPAHRPQMPQGGFQNPFAQQQQIQTPVPQMPGMGSTGLLSPQTPDNDPQMRKLLSGLLSGA
jgi:hypothetical protein